MQGNHLSTWSLNTSKHSPRSNHRCLHLLSQLHWARRLSTPLPSTTALNGSITCRNWHSEQPGDSYTLPANQNATCFLAVLFQKTPVCLFVCLFVWHIAVERREAKAVDHTRQSARCPPWRARGFKSTAWLSRAYGTSPSGDGFRMLPCNNGIKKDHLY